MNFSNNYQINLQRITYNHTHIIINQLSYSMYLYFPIKTSPIYSLSQTLNILHYIINISFFLIKLHSFHLTTFPLLFINPFFYKPLFIFFHSPYFILLLPSYLINIISFQLSLLQL